MDSQRWNWRMRPGINPGDALVPTPSNIWVGANVTPPSSTSPSNLLTGQVLLHPSLTVTTVRVRLLQQIVIRRDVTRRRARSSPCPSAVSCQWAGAVTLGTGVHKGGVVADCIIVEGNAVPHISTHPSHVRQCTFNLRLPEHLPRTWTWTACEGDRKKIWFLDMRYRIIAEAFHNGQLVAAARSFVPFCPTYTTCPPPLVGRSRAPSASPVVSSWPPIGPSRGFDNTLTSPEITSPEPDYKPGSSPEDDHSWLAAETESDIILRSRTAMAFARPSQPDETPKRQRYTDTKISSGPERSISLLASTCDRPSAALTKSLTALGLSSSQSVSKSSSQSKKPTWIPFTSSDDFDDMTVTTTLQVPQRPQNPHRHAQFKLTEQVAATINLVPKMGLSQLKIRAVLTEIIEITDDRGTRQVHLQHHYRMGVSPIPTTASRRQEISCIAQMTASDKLFSADASFDFMRVTHRLDISVSYERRRVLGGFLFAEVAHAEHDLWDIVDGTDMKVVSSTPICLRHGEKPEQQCIVPMLAVWGSTERIAAVGTAESRPPKRKPGWATSDAEEQIQQFESKIDALRSLAYANAGSRVREERREERVGEDLRRFPTFKVDETGPLAKQSCPVCLELLDGVVTMLPCLHAGHRSCFGRSQNNASVCPVCRLDLSPYVGGESGVISVEAA